MRTASKSLPVALLLSFQLLLAVSVLAQQPAQERHYPQCKISINGGVLSYGSYLEQHRAFAKDLGFSERTNYTPYTFVQFPKPRYNQNSPFYISLGFESRLTAKSSVDINVGWNGVKKISMSHWTADTVDFYLLFPSARVIEHRYNQSLSVEIKEQHFQLDLLYRYWPYGQDNFYLGIGPNLLFSMQDYYFFNGWPNRNYQTALGARAGIGMETNLNKKRTLALGLQLFYQQTFTPMYLPYFEKDQGPKATEYPSPLLSASPESFTVIFEKRKRYFPRGILGGVYLTYALSRR